MEEIFEKPNKPFILISENEIDGISIAYLETKDDMIKAIKEVKSYGDTIVKAIEIETYRNFDFDKI